jgi:dipeptidyl aminopeptidase/acylaminoacyl peptidase
MRRRRPFLALPLALLPLLAAPLASAPQPPAAAPADPGEEGTLPVPESMVVHGIPPIRREIALALQPYGEIRSASFSDWDPEARRMLVGTRFADTVQLHEVARPLGARTQLTFLKERVTNGAYRPGSPDQIVFASDVGGAENYQLFLLDRRTGKIRRLTDGRHRFLSPLWSRDGRRLAYVGNPRNGRDFDLYVQDIGQDIGQDTRSGEPARRVAELAGSWTPLDWTADGGRLLLVEEVSINESHLHWVDVATGKVHRLTPPPAQGTAAYQGGRWSPDGRAVYTATDRGGEFLRLVRLDVATGTAKVLSGDVPWGVEDFDLSRDGRVLAFSIDADGISRLRLVDAATGATLPGPELPPGVVRGLAFRPGSHEIGFSHSSGRSPSDAWSWDPDARRLERWTASETGGLPPAAFASPELVRYPTFDETAPGVRRTIPAFVYRPPADRFPGRRPVLLEIHGGPESQTRADFLGSSNYLVQELGIVLLRPNVRGSTGYGRTYSRLDNGMKREDSVKDIGSLLDWIAAQPDMDPNRVMVSGGSYGGYMSLAVLVHYSDRLRCGEEAVGISNFVTFLEHTQAYRRDLRRVEYGDERNPEMRAFLESIAPANHADRITRPLMVAEGANDPRVPPAEADAITSAVRGKGVPVWYMVAKNEGHGFAKKENSDYLRAAFVAFIQRYLLEGQALGEEGKAQESAGR